MDIWNNQKSSGQEAPPAADGLWGQKANPGTPAGAPVETASSPAPATTQPKRGVSRDDYWANKEERDLEKERIYREEDIPAMRRSTAYTTAAQLAGAALAGDALSFGSVAKGKRLDMYLDYVDLIAARVLARLNGEELAPCPGQDDVIDVEPDVAQEEADLG